MLRSVSRMFKYCGESVRLSQKNDESVADKFVIEGNDTAHELGAVEIWEKPL